MTCSKHLSSLVAGAILSAVSSLATAGSVYGVSNTGHVNCSTGGNAAPHGLWTNQYRKGGGGCSQYYGFQEGSTLSLNGGIAQLDATAVNPAGVTANIDFTFTSPVAAADWTGDVKTAGGGDSSHWTFYEIGSGNIDVSYEREWGGVSYRVLDQFSLDLVDNTSFQFGMGANDKTTTFGASAWLDIETWTRTTSISLFNKLTLAWDPVALKPAWFDRKLGTHWDLNMDLAAVPLPAAAWLFITGLLGVFGFGRYSKRRAEAAAA